MSRALRARQANMMSSALPLICGGGLLPDLCVVRPSPARLPEPTEMPEAKRLRMLGRSMSPIQVAALVGALSVGVSR